jgi:hypothetical protein
MVVTIDGAGLTTAFIGLHSVTTESLRTLSVSQLTTEYLTTTESQATHSHNWLWVTTPTDSSLKTLTRNLYSTHNLTVFPNWLISKQAVAYCWHSPAWLFLVSGPIGTHDYIFVLIYNPYGIRRWTSSSVRGGVGRFNAVIHFSRC